MIQIGVVGYGYWGPNLVRNFAEAKGARVACVCDSQASRLEPLRARYPAIETTTDFDGLLGNADIDAVVVATPVSTHFDLAMRALEAGKHVLVEKPLATSADEGRRLVEEARKRERVLMVDHTFVYTGAVRKIRELAESGRLGEILYYDSVRVNLGLFQHDVNVIWDLAVHDLSIMDFVLPFKPRAVSATGMSHVAGQPENIAFITLFFEASMIAHIHVNWLAPVKVRQTLIGGSKEMVVYDDLEPSEKIKIYDKGVTLTEESEAIYEMRVGYRSGDMLAPELDRREALAREADHFLDCIRTGERPETDGESGLRVVEILEAATQSMSEQGRPVDIDGGESG